MMNLPFLTIQIPTVNRRLMRWKALDQDISLKPPIMGNRKDPSQNSKEENQYGSNHPGMTSKTKKEIHQQQRNANQAMKTKSSAVAGADQINTGDMNALIEKKVSRNLQIGINKEN